MIKMYSRVFALGLVLSVALLAGCNHVTNEKVEGDNDAYDGPMERTMLEFEKTKDPALGRVPIERLWNAVLYTENEKQNYQLRGNALNWQERGPIYDSVGPGNGNGRGSATGTYSSGRVRGVMVDEADATGNTVFVGGVAGGIFKCTNFTSTIPNWQAVNDFFPNLAISYIAQQPGLPSTMYFTTGEPTSNVDAVLGMGVWKSTNSGATWTHLTSTMSYTRIFKILVDATGTLYLATRSNGLLRSLNGGTTWLNISPNGVAGNNDVTDIEFSDGGRLHASLGYGSGTTNTRYSDIPSTATSIFGWNAPTGLLTAANRIELAASGTTLYAAPTNTSNNVISAYRSNDNGATWTKTNTVNFTTGVSNTQGWYNISLEINPEDPNHFIVAGLDAYRTIDGGVSLIKMTNWVNGTPYAHADHHFAKWFVVGFESRILLGTDGGLFLSRNNGLAFTDKNQNLGIKQFYSCAIHPTLTNYFIGGTQDNGTHQFKFPGLASTVEVQGGDGGYTAIDVNEPLIQFTSTTQSNFRRSSNGGTAWTIFDFGNNGFFINPFEYDGLSNKFYSSNGSTLRRWENPTTAIVQGDAQTSILTVPGTFGGSLTAFTVSPNTPNRLFIGVNNGRLIKLDNADTVTSSYIFDRATSIGGGSFNGYLNNIAVGSTDDHLVAIFTNYGVNNVWYTSDGGTNWSAIDGNLPDMPVRWALFDPFSNGRLIIATEAGVYTTSLVNGSSTVWVPSSGFPTVRTDMLRFRPSDNLVLAATHGRGMWSTNISQNSLPVKNLTLYGTVQSENRASLKWTSEGETSKTNYRLQYCTDGVSFKEIANLPVTVKNFIHSMTAPVGYYRVMALDINQMPVFSNVIALKSGKTVPGLHVKIQPNPVRDNASFVVSNNQSGNFIFVVYDIMGKALHSGKGSLTNGSNTIVPLQVKNFPAGLYRVKVKFDKEIVTSNFIKQ